MLPLAAEVDLAAELIHAKWSGSPRVGIILGTGLGSLAERVRDAVRIPYSDVPLAGLQRKQGQLVCGHLEAVPVIAVQGRLHLYEGFSAQQTAQPVRLMKRLGVEILIVTNASGGLNPQLQSGDVMVIEDHINLTWRNPLIGINDDRLGPRFPDMSQPYDHGLMQAALAAGRAGGFGCHQGVYAAMSGPTYETRAEYRMLRRLGADVVGMSTVPETLVAVHAGLRVLGLSTVTNLCRPDTLESTSGHEVEAAATRAVPKVWQIVRAVVTELDNHATVS